MVFIWVIIPVYNVKNYLSEAVFSVLNQPYKGIKIVLVDDGSNDGSGELCDELAAQEKRIVTIHQKNAGVSSARNTGIDFVMEFAKQRDYIAFLDADDLWNQNIITNDIISVIENNSDVEMLLFGGISSDEKCSAFSKPICYDKRICSGGEKIIWPMQGHFGSNMYSLKLFHTWKIRFKEGLKYAEDKIFKMQCMFLAQKVCYMSGILYIYRENNNSAMRKVFLYSPIDYYIPIINAWIESDDFINCMKGNHSITAGYTLASIYFGDMIVEHYKRWKSKKELYNICNSHPYYYLFINMNRKAVSKKQYGNKKMFLKHPILFALKYRTIGVLEYFARVVLQINIVHNSKMRRKYPFVKIPLTE